MTRINIVIAAGLVLAVTLPAVSAQAQVARTFVSAAGSDSNNCANVSTPCRHFATAFAATAPSGEIFVLDPANYGSLTITHAVSIQGHGWASIAPPNGGNAITINAGPGDSISIHGVAIDGTGATGGTNGIVFNSGASLTVTDCVVKDFVYNNTADTGNGILIQPSSSVNFAITNTTAAHNGNVGIFYEPPSGSFNANGVIDHVVVDSNFHGIDLITTLATGGTTVVTISNTIASNNSCCGIFASNGPGALKVSIDSVSVSGNTGFWGIEADNTAAKVLLGRSVITGNATGVAVANGATVYTYGDNRINLNGTDISGTLNTSFATR
jgi:hypothetical protein